MRDGGDTKSIVEREGFRQVSDRTALEGMAQQVLAANQTAVDEYRSGKKNAMKYLVGQAMKASKGSGNPTLFAEIFKEMLKN